jgi:sec-independent protein translocase protein TatA
MFRGLLEGWHPVVLVIVIAVLFGGKRLPDAARGLGRSLRIFKAEVKEMRTDSGSTTIPVTPEPIEGKIVNSDTAGRRVDTASEHRHDA